MTQENDLPALQVWPDVMDVLDAVYAMRTQWKWASGKRVGFDYQALDFVLPRIGMAKDSNRFDFQLFQLAEDTILEALHQ